MIDVTAEKALTLAEAAKLPELMRNGRKPHVASLFRWTSAGVRGHKLESIQIAGSRCTTRQAVQRFLHALNGGTGNASTAVYAREHDRAEKILAGAGI